MRVLAFDTATRTGWALCEAGRRIDSGTFVVPKGGLGERFAAFAAQVHEVFHRVTVHHDGGITVVAAERAVFGGASSLAARELLQGLSAVLLMTCARSRIEVRRVMPSTLKKHVTGSGRAKKGDVILAMRKRWGYCVRDDNEADALAVAAWAIDTSKETP